MQLKYIILILCYFKFITSHLLSDISSRGLYPKGKKLIGPGYGFDYLLGSISGYPLLNVSFNNLQTTNDETFLVPDCMVVEDNKIVDHMDSAEIIESSQQYTDISSRSLSASLSASAKLGIVSASFSASYSQNFKDMMDEQTKTKTVTIRSKYFDHRYSLMLNSDCKLNKGFESYIKEIAECLVNGDDDWAKYLSEELVRDYGTHYVKKAHIGGIFYMDDFLSSSYWFRMDNSYSDAKFQAEMRFKAGFFSGGASTSISQQSNTTQTQEYSKNVRITKAQSIGGLFKPGNTVNDWAKTLDDNLAIIDKEIDSIETFVTYFNFPDIERIYLAKTRELVENAIESYLRKNLIKDCLDRKSINYQPFSNSHDPKACKEDYIFGAYYEVRRECGDDACTDLYTSNIANYLTKGTSCPDGFTEKKHTFNKPGQQLYDIVECIGDSSLDKSPILFGGIYSEIEDNPVTGSKNCAFNFDAKPFLQTKATICLSRNFREGIEYAIPFLGFMSTCDIKRASKLKCKKSYYDKKFIATVNGCYIYYCTRVKKNERLQIKKPPFVQMPQKNYNSKRIH